MEKENVQWINAFARSLRIQKVTEKGTETERASPEQVDAFAQLVTEDLDARKKHMSTGDTITYKFLKRELRGCGQGHVRPNSHTPMYVKSISDALTELLEKLEKMQGLPDGMYYVFKMPTYITFELVGNAGSDDDFVVISACVWTPQNP